MYSPTLAATTCWKSCPPFSVKLGISEREPLISSMESLIFFIWGNSSGGMSVLAIAFFNSISVKGMFLLASLTFILGFIDLFVKKS